MRITSASPQAAKLSLHFFLGNLKNQSCFTYTRDLIKDTPLIERYEGEEKREKVQHPVGIEPGTSRTIIRCATP